jgi:predicted MFS family arabinose efflux permease
MLGQTRIFMASLEESHVPSLYRRDPDLHELQHLRIPSAVNPIAEHFGISTQKARIGQMIYLVAYSFGCELWAPWSEEFGRWPILQLSMLLINVWQIPNMFAKNFGTIVVGRALVSQ